MSSYNPPNPYFNGIDFNKSFFSIQGNFITLAYATKTYLNKITGGIISGLVSIIYSTSSPQLLIQNTNTSSTSSLILNNSTSTRGLTMGVGNASSSTYQNQAHIEAGASTDLVINAGGYSATPELLLSASGNVGIGTATASQKLTIYGGAVHLLGSISANPGTSTSASFWYRSGIGPTISGDNIAFQINGTTDIMRITAVGNVGIGTINPLSKLHINSGAILKALSFYDLGNDYQYTGLGASGGLNLNVPASSDAFQFRVGASSTTANEVMRITGAGVVNMTNQLSIIASATQNLLYLKSTLPNASTNIQMGNDTAGNCYWGFGSSTSGNLYANNCFIESPPSTKIFFNAGGYLATPTLTVSSTANVGIGTSTPQNKLDVRGTIQTEGLSIVDNTSYTNQYQLLILPPTASVGASIQTIQQNVGFNQNLSLQYAGTGGVGIGTNNPQSKLDVRGAVAIKTVNDLAAPSTGLYGGTGDRVIIKPAANSSSYPYSIGADNESIWLSVPSADYIKHIINGNVILKMGAVNSLLSSRLDITYSQNTSVNVTGASGSLITGYSGSGLLYWGNVSGATVTNQSFSGGILTSLQAVGAIICSTYVCTSDKRIKKNFKPIENISTVINSLNPIQYDFIKTDKTTTGFIAQEVAEIYPSATSMTKDFIPNIMEKATINGNIITFPNSKDIILSVGNAIKMCKKDDYNNGDGIIITGIIDNNNFTILDEDAKLFTDGYVYLYGLAVADFMNVDYNEITTLNTKAIQDLYSIITKQQEQINLLLSMR
jgi:hypothetical protein